MTSLFYGEVGQTVANKVRMMYRVTTDLSGCLPTFVVNNVRVAI